MTRLITIACEHIRAENEYILELTQSQVPLLALELGLVLKGMADKLILQFSDGDSMALSIDEHAEKNDRAVIEEQPGRLCVVLTRNQAEYIYSFLLRTYRDRVAEVNHIHVEGYAEGRSYDLTLFFAEYTEPMTPEQAAKLMGDNSPRRG